MDKLFSVLVSCNILDGLHIYCKQHGNEKYLMYVYEFKSCTNLEDHFVEKICNDPCYYHPAIESYITTYHSSVEYLGTYNHNKNIHHDSRLFKLF